MRGIFGAGTGRRRIRAGREQARLPELEQGFETAEEAGEAGEDEGVQGRDRAEAAGAVGGFAVGLGAHGGDEAGEAWGRGGGCEVHLGHIT